MLGVGWWDKRAVTVVVSSVRRRATCPCEVPDSLWVKRPSLYLDVAVLEVRVADVPYLSDGDSAGTAGRGPFV